MVVGIALTLAVLAAACSSGGSGSSSGSGGAGGAEGVSADGVVTITTLSTAPDDVTGGDVLVRVVVAPKAESSSTEFEVQAGGKSQQAAFTLATQDPHATFVGLVKDLPEGPSDITVTSAGSTASLQVVNHPINGPVFSGPHQTPFICTTQSNGLGPATDADCSAATKTTLHYLSTDGSLKDLTTVGKPADLAQVTVNGASVAGIVREERGVINRSVYQFAIVDPTAADVVPTATTPSPPAPDPGWNKRLVYRFGGGCGTSYSQGGNFTSALDGALLGRGYAVVTSTLNTFQTSCNATVSAETAMMVKEHIIETVGVPDLTIGDGGSGGAIQQLLIAQNYPGLLDGIAPSLPFPDAISISGGVTDCGLLNHYYRGAGASLTDAQRVAINGHMTTGTCNLWERTFLGGVNPTDDCPLVPADQRFDATTNPQGTRCDLADSNVNILGTDPATGYARRPLDNVGVAYGLKALTNGAITVDQFLDLNAGVGGYDINGQIQSVRTVGDADTLRTAYAKGQVIEGEGLWKVPIILTNLYTDPYGDIHDRLRAFSIRDRLVRPDGSADPNLLIWTVPAAGLSVKALTGALDGADNATEVLDRWLTTARSVPGDDQAAKLDAARPADAVDSCTLADGTVITGPDTYAAANACTAAYPIHDDPRTAAGAPRRNDILKCQVQPAEEFQPPVPFTEAQRQRLAAVFPDGLCDWTKSGVGVVPIEGTWLSYGS
ncbi:MAG TPA: DUF6351 family protein [Acidimicrobiales bacterium]